jgi:biopolymer transport protein ExbD
MGAMRALLLVFLAGQVFAGEETEAKPKVEVPTLMATDARVRLAHASAASKNDNDAQVRVVVNLDANGAIRVGKVSVTLERLESVLRAQVAKITKPNSPTSEMKVLLRIDKDAPWVHAAWLFSTCAQCRIYRIRVSAVRPDGTEGFLKQWLQVDQGLAGDDLNDNREKAWTFIYGRGDKQALYGPADARVKVNKPVKAAFRLGAKETDEIVNLRIGLGEIRKKAKSTELGVHSQLSADIRVPWHFVVLALNAYGAEKLKAVTLHGVSAPKAEHKKSLFLPYPTLAPKRPRPHKFLPFPRPSEDAK